MISNDSEELMARADQAERFMRQLANRCRLMVLCQLSDGERSVGEINQAVPLSQSALSQHLKVLREAGVVQTRRQSQTIYYRLSDPALMDWLNQLCELSDRFGQAASNGQKGVTAC